METVGCREKPLPGDDGGTAVGRSNKVEADLPRPGPFLGVRAPDDAVEGGGTPAAAFSRRRVTWLKGRLTTGNEVKCSAGLGTDSLSHQFEISLSRLEEAHRSVWNQQQQSTPIHWECALTWSFYAGLHVTEEPGVKAGRCKQQPGVRLLGCIPNVTKLRTWLGICADLRQSIWDWICEAWTNENPPKTSCQSTFFPV